MSARLHETDRRVVGLAIPALGTLAAEPLYRIVDTAIVGRLGTDQLAGLAIAVTLLALVVAGSNFLTYGTTQRVANRLGSPRPDEAADVGVQAMWLAGIVSVVAVPALVFGARPLASAIVWKSLGTSSVSMPRRIAAKSWSASLTKVWNS